MGKLYTKRERNLVGSRFRSLRKRTRMSQRELAFHLGMSDCTISLIENGHVFPHRSTLRKFALIEAQNKTDYLATKRREYTQRRTGDNNAGKNNISTDGSSQRLHR